MKKHRISFRRRMMYALLAASLIPLLLCSTMMMQIYRMRMEYNARLSAEEGEASVLSQLDQLVLGCTACAESLRSNTSVLIALHDAGISDTQIYNSLFTASEQIRNYCYVHIYDVSGTLRWSTQSSGAESALPVNWNILNAAAETESMVWLSADGGTADDSVLLRASQSIRLRDGSLCGFLVFDITASHFKTLLDGTCNAQEELLLADRYFRSIYESRTGMAETLLPAFRDSLLESGSIERESDDYQHDIFVHDATGLLCIYCQPLVFSTETLQLLYGLSAGMSLVCIIISLMLSWKLSNAMYRPLGNLRDAIAQVERNDLNVTVGDDSTDEFSSLNTSFNKMILALRENQAALLQNERELNEAQIRMLQAQLNPHFLCNTLDTMKWISKINRVPQVATMSTNLADILRFCISPEEFVTLSRELSVLKRYIEIQEIRLSDRFSFTLHIAPELRDCLVPKMLLQPIVENSILHGIDGLDAGKIKLDARKSDDETLEVIISDNGPGYPVGMLGDYHEPPGNPGGHHLGLYNIHTILTKHYGSNFGIRLDNGPNGGAVTIARLPIIHEEKTDA